MVGYAVSEAAMVARQERGRRLGSSPREVGDVDLVVDGIGASHQCLIRGYGDLTGVDERRDVVSALAAGDSGCCSVCAADRNRKECQHSMLSLSGHKTSGSRMAARASPA